MKQFWVMLAGLSPMPVLAQQAQPLPQLVSIGSNSAGAEILVDRSSLRASRPTDAPAGVTTMLLRSEIRTPGGRRTGPMTERMLHSFNCRARTLNTITYYRGWANGSRSHDWHAADLMRKYEAVRPGSLIELAMTFACNGGRMPDPPQLREEVLKDDDDGI